MSKANKIRIFGGTSMLIFYDSTMWMTPYRYYFHCHERYNDHWRQKISEFMNIQF